MHKILYAINSIIAACLVLSYLSPYTDPGISWFIPLFGLFYPPILLANFAFILLWFVIKPKYTLLSIIVILLGWGPLARTIGLLHSSSGEKGIKVMAYNIGKTRINFNRKDKNKHIRAFKKFIEIEQPDVVCVQERIKGHLKHYRKIFNEYHIYPDSELGTGIYSKYPIIQGGNMPFETVAHNATWADVVMNNDTVRFYSIHLSSNRITKVTGEMLENPDISRTEFLKDLKFIFNKYNQHAQLRSQQVDQIMAHASKSPYPVILSGDFNDVPQSYVYRKISKSYCDAFCFVGTGMEKTFISFMPGLRIDYSFLDKSIKVLDHYIIRTSLSDHYPVVTIIDPSN
ncbi:MAG: endonuclease/exonuclease/phosphatase family protein [Saprospiraceae bacterium]|nr:endonuclease/exonuclease/phosphatase family protein [Bacteroidia bacterium]MBT8230953.1 endonuclease/exonuclease/phosphatase family protein [Bacteroidia bacterium]NNF20667.1 endonuclease/exonuclease/phosphatase family protein [Saprospiraceae bacterium]